MGLIRSALLLAAGITAYRWARRKPAPRAAHVRGIARVVPDLGAAQAFYVEALGFTAAGRASVPTSVLAALGLAGERAEYASLRLGRETVYLVRFAMPGQPYPADSASDDAWFQHLAIVVSDMDAAYARLQSVPGWTPITQGGPQLLPPGNGGVRAFKFRDPAGHPLELLWFPPGQGRAMWQHGSGVTLGIDHSALAVRSGTASLRFYRGLGFTENHRSRNRGPAQSRLDALPAADVEVIGLRIPGSAGAGLELLRYHPPGRPARTRPRDQVTDLTVLAAPGKTLRALRDPDGHMILLTGAA